MPVRLDSRSPDFAQQFLRLLATKREVSADIERATRVIVDDVAARGDIALIEATRKLKKVLTMTAADPLKLFALDADDLAVISAHVQDARVQAADIVWRQDEKRLVVGMNRLDWEQTLSGETAPRRLIAALRFDRVLACKSRNIDLGAPETELELLGIEFHPGEAPGGSAVLIFSQGGALRLDVECLECELTDLGTDDLGTSDFGEGAEPSGWDA